MNRRYDFDWLRVFGAVMVVVAHCAGMFITWSPPFYSVEKTKVFNELLWNLNLWLMPLFMLLAGASAWFTLRKWSNRRYVQERLLHLGVPLAVLTLTFGIPAAFAFQTSIGQYRGSLVEFYVRFFDFFPSNTYHLWFLVYLLIYGALTLPLFRFLQSDAATLLMDRLARACRPMGGIYLFAVPLVVVQVAWAGTSRPAPFAAPPNDWTRLATLLIVFVSGYVLVSDTRFQSAVARQWPLTAAAAIVTSVIMFAIAWPDEFNPFIALYVDYSLEYYAFWTLFGLCTWSWLMAWLGFGQRFLNVNHPLLESLSPLIYPLYLLHPIVLFPALLAIAQWPINPFIAFPVLTATVLAGTVALTTILYRWRVTRALLGLKRETARVRVDGENSLNEGSVGASARLHLPVMSMRELVMRLRHPGVSTIASK